MASSPTSSPSYGERPPLQGYRRSFTVPHRALSHHERAGLDESDADSGMIYQHPSVRVISFAPPVESIKSKSSETHADADYPIDTVETLPWRSRTEDLIASGLMKIEKVKGSVNFLKCGSVVHSILRNSQCWCVDGESKFVLRRGQLRYYRIELPISTEEERQKVEELKNVLPKVLKFERTPCPFKRAFHVSLPDDAITPRRKGKWKRKEGSLGSAIDTDEFKQNRNKITRSWTMHTPPREVLDQLERRRESDYGLVPRLHYGRKVEPTSTQSDLSSGESEDSHDFEDEGSEHDSTSQEKEEPQNLETTSEVANGVPEPAMVQLIDGDYGKGQRGETSKPDPAHANSISVSQEAEAEGEHDDHLQVDVEEMPENVAEHIDEQSGSLESTPGLEKTLPPAQNGAMDDEMNHVDLNKPTEDTDTNAESVEGADQDFGINQPIVETTTAAIEQEPEIPIEAQTPAQEQEIVARVDEESLQETRDEVPDDTESIASTIDTFHTVDSISDEQLDAPTFEDVEPTPLAESFDPLGAKQHSHRREISEVTVTADSLTRGQPGTPGLIKSSASDESWPDVQTPSSNIQEGLRQRLKQHRSQSPLPPADNVFRPTPTNDGNHLTAAIIQKACNVALVKPIEIVVLVVHVLARIAGGATVNDLWSGELFKRPTPSRHHRNSSFPDRVARHEDDDEEEEEDDFGVPLRGVNSRGRSKSPSTDQGVKGASTARDTDADSIFDDLD